MKRHETAHIDHLARAGWYVADVWAHLQQEGAEDLATQAEALMNAIHTEILARRQGRSS